MYSEGELSLPAGWRVSPGRRSHAGRVQGVVRHTKIDITVKFMMYSYLKISARQTCNEKQYCGFLSRGK